MFYHILLVLDNTCLGLSSLCNTELSFPHIRLNLLGFYARISKRKAILFSTNPIHLLSLFFFTPVSLVFQSLCSFFFLNLSFIWGYLCSIIPSLAGFFSYLTYSTPLLVLTFISPRLCTFLSLCNCNFPS